MSTDDVADRVRKIIADHLGHDVENVTDSKSILDDLGADSLDQVELAMGLEQEFDIEIPDDEFEGADLVSDAVKIVRGRLA